MTAPGHSDRPLDTKTAIPSAGDRCSLGDAREGTLEPFVPSLNSSKFSGVNDSRRNQAPQRNAISENEKLPSVETVLYLAYGSNLSSKTFRGTRGVRPISQTVVVVPELRLTFDMPGIPYIEPCFAATRFARLPTRGKTSDDLEESGESDPLVTQGDYDRDTWLQPVIGVVYEVSLEDYARIIATEGGGRGYKDVVVDCYPLPDSYLPSDPIPYHPPTVPVKAHSLLSPAVDESSYLLASFSHKRKAPGIRPDPTHAQPSARYLRLIATGAAEHDLPFVYREYLEQIRPYRTTTVRQSIGRLLFVVLWGPVIISTMALSRMLAGPSGRSPAWLIAVSNTAMRVMWWSYDDIFVRLFGEGERTIGDT